METQTITSLKRNILLVLGCVCWGKFNPLYSAFRYVSSFSLSLGFASNMWIVYSDVFIVRSSRQMESLKANSLTIELFPCSAMCLIIRTWWKRTRSAQHSDTETFLCCLINGLCANTIRSKWAIIYVVCVRVFRAASRRKRSQPSEEETRFDSVPIHPEVCANDRNYAWHNGDSEEAICSFDVLTGRIYQ